MKRTSRKGWVALIAVLALLAAPGAIAGTILPGSYTLLDHGNGSLGPAYGLRVDSIGEIFSFSLGAAGVQLDWDGGTTAVFWGDINRNTMGGNGGVGDIWHITYNLTGVSAVGTLGFTATGGNGFVQDHLFHNTTNLVSLQNEDGFVFEFLADGHRIDGDNDTPVGRGWIQPPDTVDDFIVRGVLLPEPGSALLTTVLLAGLALLRRR